MEERIAKITSAELGPEDHGIFTALVQLDYGDSTGQGVPGYCLDRPGPDRSCRVGTAYGLTWIMRFMDACGVDRWSKVAGRTILAVIDGGSVVGVKPLPTEPGRSFIFADLREQFDELGFPGEAA